MNKLFPDKPVLKQQKQKQKQIGKQRPQSEPPKKRKAKIPSAVQEAIWIQKMGRVFEGKCLTTWCPNIINVFDYHAGHDIPESKGGTIDPENLFPICARCNLSMGDRYTFKEWCLIQTPQMTPNPLHQVPVVPVKKSWWCSC